MSYEPCKREEGGGDGIVNVKSSLSSEPWKREEGEWYSQRMSYGRRGGGIVNVKIPLSSELRKREEGVMVFST